MKKNMILLGLILSFMLIFPMNVLAENDDLYYNVWGIEKELKPFIATDKEIVILEKIVMAEAEAEPFLGQLAVANVIINRVRSPLFPDSIEKVVFQKNQFTPVKNGRYEKVIPNETTKLAVRLALQGLEIIPQDTLFFSNVAIMSSSWVVDNREYLFDIGNHSFFK